MFEQLESHSQRQIFERVVGCAHEISVNCLELMAVWLALRLFLTLLRVNWVLVRIDNTTIVAYVNKQRVLRSRTLANRLILWSDSHLLSRPPFKPLQ